MVIYKIVCPSF